MPYEFRSSIARIEKVHTKTLILNIICAVVDACNKLFFTRNQNANSFPSIKFQS